MDSSVEMLSAAADSLVTLINNASVAEDCIGQQLCRQCSWETWSFCRATFSFRRGFIEMQLVLYKYMSY